MADRNAKQLAEFIINQEHKWKGERLKEDPFARVTNEEFAHYIGIPPSTYSEIRRAHHLPSYQVLDQLAAKFGIDVYIKTGKAPRLPSDPRILSILGKWHLYTEDERDDLCEYAKSLGDEDHQPAIVGPS